MLRGVRERQLRAVLLVKAIEETDRDGELLALGDRAEATRAVARGAPPAADATGSSEKLPARTQTLLWQRALRLSQRLAPRYPIVAQVLRVPDALPWIAPLLLALAVATGAGLSALDGARRINILAFPLAGLVAWNLLVYAVSIARMLRSRMDAPRSNAFTPIVARAMRVRIGRWLGDAARFDVRLAAALERFAADWQPIARPLLLLGAKRLLHLAAAATALGLIGGLYLRGVVLEYAAVWESTFLDATQARALLAVLYGPASALTGIPLPEATQLAALRASGAQGGANAAPWIHLMAATAAIYVVVPRIALAILVTLRLAWLHRRAPLPEALVPYAREVLSGTPAGGVARSVRVVPYGQALAPESQRGLEQALRAALGGEVAVEMHDPIAYGSEEELAARRAPGSSRAFDREALVVSLAATPEEENHGAAILGLREAIRRSGSHARHLLLVDESPLAARLRGDESLARRLEERRELWRKFAAAHGVRAVMLDLSAGGDPHGAPPEGLVESLRGALAEAKS
jgi:hypothetical protein